MHRRFHRRLIAFILCIWLSIVSACSVPSQESQGSAGGKELKFVTVLAADSTDPHMVSGSFILNSGSIETLVRLDPTTGKLAPWLAETWETQDGEHWTFTLRKGVKFHNGKPMTAEAVKASLEDSITKNPSAAKAVQIASVEAPDESTLKITTQGVYPGLPSNLVYYSTAITDVAAEGDLPIATGAFKFESFDPAGEAVLVKNTDYWDGQAKLDRVVMTANKDANARLLSLQAGDVDVIYRPSLESLASISNNADLATDSVPGTRMYHIMYNYSGANADLWNNLEFRKGMDALMDRDGIAKNVLNGEATVAYNVFPGNYPFSPAPLKHDAGPEAALEHFKAAGLEVADGKVTHNGAPLTLNLATYAARPELPLIAQVLRDSAAKVGITMEINVADNIDEELPKGNFDLATYSLLTITRGDGSFFLNGAFTPDGAQNHGHLNDPNLQQQIDVFNTEINEAKRAETAKGIATYIEEQYYNSYLVVPQETAAFKKKVTGWVTPSNEFEYQMITKDLDIE